MKGWILLLLQLLPLGLRAQSSVVFVPAPPLAVNPANPSSHGVSISPGLGDTPSYNIDLNGDGVVDFTLTSVLHSQAFDIIPAGNNAVLAYVVDSFGSSEVAKLGVGDFVGPSSSMSPVWQSSITISPGNVIYPNITASFNDFTEGDFYNSSGAIGVEFFANGKPYYGFLQIDCRAYGGYGGFFEGYAWNTASGEGLTVEPVPEPGTWVLLALGAAAFAVRRKLSLACNRPR